MSDELVQRLREWHEDDEDLSLMRDAADEIERLRAEVGKLRVQRAGEDVRLADAISERDALRAEIEGLKFACQILAKDSDDRDAWHQFALAARKERDEAQSALAALRKRVESGIVVATEVEQVSENERIVWLVDAALPPEFEGKTALVVLGEG